MNTAFFALLIGSMIAILPVASAEAAPHERPRASTDVKLAGSKLAEAVPDPLTTSSISKAAGDEGPGCNRARRRLWVEGEGWVVRRVATCY
jgi:hypothetical protein